MEALAVGYLAKLDASRGGWVTAITTDTDVVPVCEAMAINDQAFAEGSGTAYCLKKYFPLPPTPSGHPVMEALAVGGLAVLDDGRGGWINASAAGVYTVPICEAIGIGE
jgi:hypothetical protein